MLLATGVARAGDPDEDYLKIYSQIEDAESLETGGQATQALAKYREAAKALALFARSHPDWNAKVVNTRLNRLADSISVLSARPASASPARTNAAASGGAIAAGAPKLLQAGAEPRKVLRLHPKAGDKQSVETTLKMSMETKMGEMEAPSMKLPVMKMTMDVNVKSVSAQGDITYELVVGDASLGDEPGALPQVVDMLKASFTKLKGMSGQGTVSDRGLSKGVEMKAPPGTDPQSRQTMEQMKEILSGAVPPLPEEAVGPGAKWEVRKTLKSQGMSIDQTSTYELVAVEGDRLTAKTTVAQRAGSQKIQSPAMPGMKLDLNKMVGNGTGELTYDLGQLLPAQATSDLRTESSMSLGGAQKQTINQKLELNVKLQAK
jgi:hypothetical protein